MTKEELATLMIDRLNQIAMHDKDALTKLIAARVPCNDSLADHPSVQVQAAPGAGFGAGFEVGFLGILNGLVGTIEDGPKKGFGFITAILDDDGNLVRFIRTPEQE